MCIRDRYIYATSFSEPPEFNDKSLSLQVATYEDFDWCCQALGDAYKHTWQTVREPVSYTHLDVYKRQGQPVTIVADVLPNHTFKGHVASLAPATGSRFSILPAENATGNFTKIVQRVPVRIALEGDGAKLDVCLLYTP